MILYQCKISFFYFDRVLKTLFAFIVVLQDSVISQSFLEPFAFVGLFTYNLREVVPLITDKTLDLGSMKLIA